MNTLWIMIILFQPYGGPATALNVPGFQSEKNCTEAATFLEAKYASVNARVACIPQPSKQ